MTERPLTPDELEDWLHIEQAGGRRIVNPERHEPDDPDEWMPHWKPRGDTGQGAPPIPPKESLESKEDTNAR